MIIVVLHMVAWGAPGGANKFLHKVEKIEILSEPRGQKAFPSFLHKA